MKIAVFQVEPTDAAFMRETLAKYKERKNPRVQVHSINAWNIHQGNLKEFDLLVMPGGKSRRYSGALGNIGGQNIKEFVEHGGKYIGVCAGAYYACRKIVWRAGHSHQIVDDNPLGLVDAEAHGPIPEFATHDNPMNGKIVSIEASNQCIPTLYIGGPQFVVDAHENVQTIARYCAVGQNNAAVIRKQLGEGAVTLISPHPEISRRQISQYLGIKNCHGPLYDSIEHVEKSKFFYSLNSQYFMELVEHALTPTIGEYF